MALQVNETKIKQENIKQNLIKPKQNIHRQNNTQTDIRIIRKLDREFFHTVDKTR